MNRATSTFLLAGIVGLVASISIAQTHPTDPLGPFTGPKRTVAKTGHTSNYDEAKVGKYTLPDPLVLANGQAVTDADTWYTKRRPELLNYYRNEIYGGVPANAPAVTWEVASPSLDVLTGAGKMKHLIAHVGSGPKATTFNVTLIIPAKATGPVPVILCINFGASARGGTARLSAPATSPSARAGGFTVGGGPTTLPTPNFSGGAVPPTVRLGIGTFQMSGTGAPAGSDPIADIIAHGYAYATVIYTEIQPDAKDTFTAGVIGQTLAPGQTAPAANQWGTISAWAWGLSRIVDYFQTDKDIDPKQIALMGHSRLGKTVIWAGAQDPRVAAVFSSCAGELGTALGRRDYGETIDDMTQNFPWQFSGNLQKYAGHWNDMPVDTHMVIALNAPHPVFLNGGTTDQWSDPHGEFLAEVAAGPVYRLLGKKDLGISELPPLDTPVISGDLGWNYHTGGHMAAPEDWQAFLQFLGKYFTTSAAQK